MDKVVFISEKLTCIAKVKVRRILDLSGFSFDTLVLNAGMRVSRGRPSSSSGANRSTEGCYDCRLTKKALWECWNASSRVLFELNYRLRVYVIIFSLHHEVHHLLIVRSLEIGFHDPLNVRCEPIYKLSGLP